MTQTLTTNEELKHLASSDNPNELTRRLARELVANREAQPVGYIAEVSGNRVGVLRGLPMPDVGSLIYTAPPAPVVNQTFTGAPGVPECFINAVEALESLYRNGQKQNWNECYTTDMAYASGILNACRAAMLAAAPEGGN